MLNTYVEVIPATKDIYAPKMGRKKLNVGAYCRVSTAEEEQQESFENQVEHYKSMSECCSIELKSYPNMKCEFAREIMSIPSICKTIKLYKKTCKKIKNMIQ